MGRGGPSASTSSPTACSRSASGRATRSASSSGRESSGRSSTSRSHSSGESTAPVYANSSPRTAPTSLGHSESVGVLVEDEEQLAKIDAVRAELPALEHVLTFEDLDDLAASGREFAAENPTALDEAGSRGLGGRPLHLHLHVGHDRPPEGLHDPPPQLLRDGRGPRPDGRQRRPRRRRCSSTCRSRTTSAALIHLSGPYAGFTLAFCVDPYKVGDALLAVRPTVFPSVPRIYEKIHAAVLAGFDEATGVKRRLVDWALDVGGRVSVLREAQERLPRGLAMQHRMADRLVYSK